MKRLISSLLILVASINLSLATVRTVCNMPYSPGQYTTFDDAKFASSPNDTIYVHGSNFNYGNTNIVFPLVIIGTGHNPIKQSALVSSFNAITISAPGVQLIGLTVNTVFAFFQGCTIKRCRFLGEPGSSSLRITDGRSWVIEGNVFDHPNFDACIDFSGGPSLNQFVQNNIFANYGFKITGLTVLPADDAFVLNNIFLGNVGFPVFGIVSGVTINNNIFYGVSPNGIGTMPTCTMNNNISFLSSSNVFLAAPGANNLSDVDPLFVSFPPYSPAMDLFDYSYDFHLGAGSPGINNGTDGTDRGIYGGIGLKFNMTGEPAIAEVTAFTITSPTVIPPGGNLTISVTSKRVP